MDYKVISPAEYFGNGVPVLQQPPQGNGSTLLMNPHIVHGAVNPHMHGGPGIMVPGGGEVGLAVLANGAVAAGQAQGYNAYGATDNYGYIVKARNYINLYQFIFFRDLIIELLIIIRVKGTLRHLLHKLPVDMTGLGILKGERIVMTMEHL